jgi:hypothetical protein
MIRRIRGTIPVLGRRGSALLLSGILWLFIAWGVAIMPIPMNRPPAPHEYIAINVRTAGWAVSGIIAILFAFIWQKFKDADGLSKLDRIGFALLMVMPAERVVSWLIVIILHIPGMPDLIPLPAFGSAVPGFTVWLVVCLQQFLINGWAEPVTPPEVDQLGGT